MDANALITDIIPLFYLCMRLLDSLKCGGILDRVPPHGGCSKCDWR